VDAYLQGKAAGMAEGLLALLALLGLEVSPTERARILGTADLTTLDRWFERAATAPSTAAVLATSVRARRGPRRGRAGARLRPER
jgi:hypothetical protein